MANIGQINGTMYTTDDFLPAAYANRLYPLLGDIYDHDANKYGLIASASNSIGTGTKVFTVTNNLTLGNVFIGPGTWVRISAAGTTGNTPNGRGNFMIGTVTSVTATGITVSVTVARGSGTFVSWTIVPLGDFLSSFTSPLPVAQGGTGQTTLTAARNALGAPDPAVGIPAFFEDFCGTWKTLDPATQYSESFIVSTVNDITQPYSATLNPASGGVLIPCGQAVYQGDTSIYNGVGRVASTGTGTTNSLPGGTLGQNDWASRPGVVGFSGIAAASRVSMGVTAVDISQNRVFPSINLHEFPVTGDVAEFAFMFPVGEAFDSTNSGGFSCGFFTLGTAGYSICFNVGNLHAMPWGNIDSGQGFGADPSAFGPMALSIITTRLLVTSTVWVDNGSQNTALLIQPGRWYKVRITPTSASIYSDGGILYKTISGWTNPTMNVSAASNLGAYFYKDGGNSKVTALLDYMYFRHACTR